MGQSKYLYRSIYIGYIYRYSYSLCSHSLYMICLRMFYIYVGACGAHLRTLMCMLNTYVDEYMCVCAYVYVYVRARFVEARNKSVKYQMAEKIIKQEANQNLIVR